MGKDSPAGLEAEDKQGFDAVEAQMLLFFPEVVEELGGDPRPLLTSVGLDLESFAEGRAHVTYRHAIELVERSAVLLHCPDFGLRLASRQAGSVRSPLVMAMKNSPTFGEALRFVTSHSYAHSLAASIWLRHQKAEEQVLLGHDILLDGLPHRSQTMEQVLFVAHSAAMEATAGLVRARQVYFRHQAVSSMKTYRHYFGCEVRFGQPADCLVFHDSDMNRPIAAADAHAHAEIAAFIDAQFPQRRPPFSAQVRGVIMHTIAGDRCTNDEVAATLNLHARTLHRRLNAEDTSFQQIKNEVRRDMMLYYLKQTDLDLAQVSERLGFAEQSAMTRYCRSCFDMSPTQLRAEARLRASR